MKIGELRELEIVEFDTLSSSWNEFIFLERIDEHEFEVSLRSFEGLGDAVDYWDEDSQEYELPDEIDGVSVFGVQGDGVVGGDLKCWNASDSTRFTDLDSSELRAWAKTQELDYRFLIDTLRTASEGGKEEK